VKTTRADDAKAVVRQALASNPTFSIGGYCATVGMGMPNKNSIDENLTISAFSNRPLSAFSNRPLSALSNRPFRINRFQAIHPAVSMSPAARALFGIGRWAPRKICVKQA